MNVECLTITNPPQAYSDSCLQQSYLCKYHKMSQLIEYMTNYKKEKVSIAKNKLSIFINYCQTFEISSNEHVTEKQANVTASSRVKGQLHDG